MMEDHHDITNRDSVIHPPNSTLHVQIPFETYFYSYITTAVPTEMKYNTIFMQILV
jgi:hypothetical protein